MLELDILQQRIEKRIKEAGHENARGKMIILIHSLKELKHTKI